MPRTRAFLCVCIFLCWSPATIAHVDSCASQSPETCQDVAGEDVTGLLQNQVHLDNIVAGVAETNHSLIDHAVAQTPTTILGALVRDLIDVDQMVEDQKADAADNVVYWQGKVDASKPELTEAKNKFKASRQTIRSQYKSCRKKIPFNKKTWQNKNACKPFKAFFSGKKYNRCNGKRKCQLRQARINAKAAAKSDLKTKQSTIRGYKKELRKAKFQKTILPKIVTLLKPSLLDALSKVDMGDGSEGVLRGCTAEDDDVTECLPLDQIGTEDLLRNYMTAQLHSTLWPKLYKVFRDIKEKIWKIVKPLKDSVKTSMVTSVGSIPVVGGALAAAVGMLIEALYYVIQYAVNGKIGDVRKLLQDKIVTAIVNAVFGTGLFTTDKLATGLTESEIESGLTIGNQAQQDIVAAEQSSLTSEAAGAEAAAAQEAQQAEASVKAEGEAAEAEEEADDAEDEQLLEEEESFDVADEDE